MTLRPEFALHHSGFEPFLFAPVWVEKSGSTLSILSAFARLEIEPWEEAGRLAGMPKDKAAAALASLLGRLPRADVSLASYPTLARDLVELLPQRPAVALPNDPRGFQWTPRSTKVGIIIGLGTLLLALQAYALFFS